MKYIDAVELVELSNYISNLSVDNLRIDGKIELFSCKMVRSDKRLAKSIEDALYESPSSLETSPFGPLQYTASRKVFVNLISTLNMSFPDYDFSNLLPSQFKKVDDLNDIISGIDETFRSVLQDRFPDFQTKLWTAIQNQITISECTAYVFLPEPDGNPLFVDGTLWSFNYFLVDNKLKRILFFHCMCGNQGFSDQDEIFDFDEF
eukprot:TRINITY_DN4882_c0_g1_i1.p1 TRINITY_DN4882_c0_g1~~TRINITY_DN4882_c0_g1_i1.p1  ORF type:complete len:222 (+),score=53.08 TRINITY_DN4882_c0_g1_i1:53-667(+)